MNAARVRIGRVKMKDAKFAVVRPSGASGHTVDIAKAWLSDVVNDERPPDALCAVAIWIIPDQPGYPIVAARYATTAPSIPTAILPDILAGYVRQDIIRWHTECQIMEKLGYTITEPPDGAA